MKPFDHAYNMKYGYATTSQFYDNLSDGDCIPNWGAAWIDAVTPFQTPAVLDIRGYAGDGSFGIIPQGSAQTAAGQDTAGDNVQVGGGVCVVCVVCVCCVCVCVCSCLCLCLCLCNCVIVLVFV